MSSVRFVTLTIASVLAASALWSCNKESDPEPEKGAEMDPARTAPALRPLESFDQRRAYVSSIRDGVISAIDLESNEIAWMDPESQ